MSAGLITIVGGSGFIGRHLVSRLAAKGYQIRLAVRDTEKAKLLITQGNVGQIAGMQTNIRNQASVERAVAGADVVINLVGLLYQSGAQKFEAVHLDGAASVAKAAKAAGAKQLIHMSALGADGESVSSYSRTKAGGERAAVEGFEGATVIRPSVVFGADDDFTNKFAGLTALVPALPLLDGGSSLMQPVWVEDLTNAIAKIIETPSCQGKVYEFGGPDEMALSQIIDSILKNTKRNCLILPVPKAMMNMVAFFLQRIPGKPFLTTDQVKLLSVDNVIGGDQAGFADLGIEPTALDAILPTYMTRFQKGGGYSELHA
ncbi:MAG: complex I NDUFA9 subunit family protein [Sneathiella sp.]